MSDTKYGPFHTTAEDVYWILDGSDRVWVEGVELADAVLNAGSGTITFIREDGSPVTVDEGAMVVFTSATQLDDTYDMNAERKAAWLHAAGLA